MIASWIQLYWLTHGGLQLVTLSLKSSNPRKYTAVNFLFKRAYQLNKKEPFIQLFESSPLFRNNLGFEMVASYLFENGKYDDILKVFDSYKSRYTSRDYLKTSQKIPYKHLQIVTTVLLKKVSGQQQVQKPLVVNLTKILALDLEHQRVVWEDERVDHAGRDPGLRVWIQLEGPLRDPGHLAGKSKSVPFQTDKFERFKRSSV